MSGLCINCEVEPRLPKRRIGQECYRASERDRSRSKYLRESPERRKARKDATTKWKFRSFYGITQNEYSELLKAQSDVCAICKELCSSGRSLAVDHCHKTGAVRGLLCGNCNRGIGQLGEDIKRLERAIDYLQRDA